MQPERSSPTRAATLWDELDTPNSSNKPTTLKGGTSVTRSIAHLGAGPLAMAACGYWSSQGPHAPLLVMFRRESPAATVDGPLEAFVMPVGSGW
jgi:hypothetical protein